MKTQNLSSKKAINSYFTHIYQYVAANFALAGAVAFFVSTNHTLFYFLIRNPILFYGIIFSPLLIIWYVSSKIETISLSTMQILYWVFGILEGISLSYIFLIYTIESIFSSLAITAGIFALASLYGRYTNSDLSEYSTIIQMGFIGVILCIIANYFMQSGFLKTVLSCAIIVLSTISIANKSQEILSNYYIKNSYINTEKIAIEAAFSLFIDVINIFIHVLRLLNDRKKD